MDDVVIPGKGDPHFQHVVAQFGGPSFMRRAQRAEAALTQLLERMRTMRHECLTMVRMRLGQLHALAGTWERLSRFVTPESLVELRQLFDELHPELRLPLEPARSDAKVHAALAELQESVERFNERWREQLARADLSEVNRRRDEYNRYYVFEKECVVGSPRIARQGFRPLDMVTREDLAGWLPIVRVVMPSHSNR